MKEKTRALSAERADSAVRDIPVNGQTPDKTRYESIPFSNDLFPVRINWSSRRTPEMKCTPVSWHEQLEILFFLSGSAYVTCDFNRYVCSAGDIVVINPCEMHSVEYCSGELVYHCLMIDPSLYDRRDDICSIKYISSITDRKAKFRNCIGDNQTVRDVLMDLLAEWREQEYGYELAVKGGLLRLFAELFRRELNVDDAKKRKPYELDQLTPALRYISDHYASNITLSDLASVCCMNRSYFCRRFHALVGRTAVTYINEYRLSKAQALLLTTSQSVSEIAQMTGFTDSSYFTRCYRSLYGVSPTEARRVGRKDNGEHITELHLQ